MKISFKFPKVSLKRREKLVLLGGMLVALAIVGYYLFTWYNDYKASLTTHASSKKLYLEKQLHRISERAELDARLNAASLELKELEKGLLPGEKPPVAAAELQKIVKEAAASQGVEIRSEKTLNPVDAGSYLAIPLEVSFTAPTAKVKEVLQRIENSPSLLTVSEVKIRVIDLRNAKDIQTFMTVRGYIKKGALEQLIEGSKPKKGNPGVKRGPKNA